jgi:hypothetical protein
MLRFGVDVTAVTASPTLTCELENTIPYHTARQNRLLLK